MITTVVYPDNGILFATKKEMSHQDRKRQGGNLNAYYKSERRQSEKVAYGMISTM